MDVGIRARRRPLREEKSSGTPMTLRSLSVLGVSWRGTSGVVIFKPNSPFRLFHEMETSKLSVR